MKKIIRSVCIDCTENPVQVLGFSSMVDILKLHNIFIHPSYDKINDIIFLDIGEDKPLEIKRGSYLVQYDDDSTKFLSKIEFDEKMREQHKNDYGFFW